MGIQVAFVLKGRSSIANLTLTALQQGKPHKDITPGSTSYVYRLCGLPDPSLNKMTSKHLRGDVISYGRHGI